MSVRVQVDGSEKVQSGLEIRMCVAEQDFPGLAVNQEDCRNVPDAVILDGLAVLVQDIDPGHPVFRNGVFPILGLGVPGDAEDFQSLVVIMCIGLLQFRNGFQARSAPGGPEIQEDIAVGGVFEDGFQADPLAVQPRKLHVDVILKGGKGVFRT